jgi:hypothetical protein
MTTSKLKTSGIVRLVLSVVLFFGIIFFIYVLVSVVFLGGHIVPRGTLPPFGAIIFTSVLVALLCYSVYSWTVYPYNIEIDENKKTIFFKNIFTRRTVLYNFSGFDGYLDTFVDTWVYREGRRRYKVIYLIKDNKIERIITGLYYANIDEMKEALSSLRYYGFEKDFSKLARKAFLKKKFLTTKKPNAQQ